MFKLCAFCGDICNDKIWCKKTLITKVNMVVGLEEPVGISTLYEDKYFCTGSHRTDYIYGPSVKAQDGDS